MTRNTSLRKRIVSTVAFVVTILLATIARGQEMYFIGDWSSISPYPPSSLYGSFSIRKTCQGIVLLGVRAVLWSPDTGRSWNRRDMSDFTCREYIGGPPPNVHFVDDSVGYGVSCSGISATIISTHDGGLTWAPIPGASPWGTGIWAWFFFCDRLHGWTQYQRDRDTVIFLLATADGGATWERIDSTTRFNSCCGYTTAYFADSLNGWSCRNYGTTTAFDWRIVRTRDGGRSWTILSRRIIPRHLTFLDSLVGFASVFAERDSVFLTTDGGVTWNLCPGQQYSARTPSALWVASDSIFCSKDTGRTWQGIPGIHCWFKTPFGPFAMLSDSLGLTLDRGNLDITRDGWKTWTNGTQFKTPPYPGVGFSTVFVSADTGYDPERVLDDQLYPLGFETFRTTDGGLSWHDHGPGMNYISQSINRDALCGTDGAYSYLSTDHGTTWDTLTSPDTSLRPNQSSSIDWMKFCDPRNGWLEINDAASSTYRYFRTTDGGRSWVRRTRVGEYVLDSLNLVGGDYRSSDDGQTWYPVIWHYPVHDDYPAFVSSSRGFDYGDDKAYLETWDGGRSWYPHPFHSGDGIFTYAGYPIAAVDSLHLISMSGYSSDGGKNWYYDSIGHTNGDYYEFGALDMVDSVTAYLSTSGGVLKLHRSPLRLGVGSTANPALLPIPNRMEVHPNPARWYVHVDFDTSFPTGVARAEVRSITGALERELRVYVSAGHATVPLGELAAGAHLVTIRSLQSERAVRVATKVVVTER